MDNQHVNSIQNFQLFVSNFKRLKGCKLSMFYEYKMTDTAKYFTIYNILQLSRPV